MPQAIPLQELGNSKLIVTVSENYATLGEYKHIFGFQQFEQLYICPFENSQRLEMVRRFVKLVQGLKKYYLDFESFSTVEEYERQFREYNVLQEFIHNSLTLRMTINVLPQIAQKLTLDRKARLSIANNQNIQSSFVYQTFVEFYCTNELKRLAANEDAYS